MEKICKKCGISFIGDRRRSYCSRACQPSKAKTRTINICQGCGKPFEAFAYHAETRRFCNMACYHKTRWGGVKSASHSCDHCGNTFDAFDCENRRFCSHDCYSASGAGAKSGTESPQWKGGTSIHYRRGADWPVSSEAARQRDGMKCRGCGKAQAAMDGKRKRLDVHHIVPWSVSKSNDISNLVTLCRSCHHRSEPRPDVVEWLHACPKHQESFLAAARLAWGLQ